MSEEKPAADLLELKLLPAWLKQSPNENPYADFAGEEAADPLQPPRRPRDKRQGRDRRPPHRAEPRRDSRREPRGREQRPPARSAPAAVREEPRPVLPEVEVRFVPEPRALERVLAEIKAGHLAYSVFSLARMFLERPERYDVRLKSTAAPLFQIGESGPAAAEQRIVETAAFPNEKENFYRIETTQADPIKGNFTSVARCRLSGTLLGPPNHHTYQPQLRSLYEQRFSRRMSFPEYQRQIEISTDPAEVERWKEEARAVTTYTTLREEPPLTFHTAAEAERHFRQNYLPALLRTTAELSVDGVVSRKLPDRALGRVIEQAWAQEVRSPSKMMQELIGGFRDSGLHLFRHRKAMLFVSPVRPRPFSHETGSVSPSVAAILNALRDEPGLNRKALLEKMLREESGDTAAELVEKKRLSLASDLHWLVSEGHVIEFNDGSLDLVRAKLPKTQPQPAGEAEAPVTEPPVGDSTMTEPAATTVPPTPVEISEPAP